MFSFKWKLNAVNYVISMCFMFHINCQQQTLSNMWDLNFQKSKWYKVVLSDIKMQLFQATGHAFL